MTCDKCKHFVPLHEPTENNLPVNGECRRYPPNVRITEWSLYGLQDSMKYPRVNAATPECGEFSQRKIPCRTDADYRIPPTE